MQQQEGRRGKDAGDPQRDHGGEQLFKVHGQDRGDDHARDHQDMPRAVDPLRQAEDAVLVDSSDLDFEQTVQAILRLAEAAHV